MQRRIVLLCCLLMPALAHADLFDTARKAMRVDLGQADSSGVTMRGGASIQSGQNTTSTTLFRGNAEVGGGCGAFDFKTSMTQAFEDMPEVIESVGKNLVSNMPMLVLCYASPTMCDLAKHWQALMNALVQAKYAQCQQIQQTMAYAGLRLRGGHESQCLEDQANQGVPIHKALDVCAGGIASMRNPAGGQAQDINLLEETLHAAGVSTEIQTLARGLLGEINLRANNGKLGSRNEHPHAAMLQRFETHQTASRDAVRAAIEELKSTGQLSDATLRAVSVPGQPIPRAAIEALVTLQHDQTRYESLLQKLTTGLSITRLTWECADIQEQLAGAIDTNAQLTDEQRRMLERRLAALQRDLNAVVAKKETVERHLQPALEALLAEHANVQAVATQAGLRAPSTGTPAMPFRKQHPIGYSR